MMTQDQFNLLLMAILFAPFLEDILVSITVKIYQAYWVSRLPKIKIDHPFLKEMLEAVEKEKGKE